MGLKIPQVPEQDRIGKISSFIQLVVFFVLLISVFFFVSRFVHGFFLRLLVFVADYVVVSLFTYLVLKPLCERIEEKLRK